jgi:thiamine pyrophosphokinase
MRVLIVSGGKQPKEATIKKYIDKDTYIISADSGSDALYKHNIIPNLILGDFDSISDEVLKFYEEKNCKINRFKAEKDFTDTEAAVLEAIKLKPKELVLLGATGTRLDHTLANLGLLYKCKKAGIESVIVDENNKVSIHSESFEFNEKEGQTFSLQAFGENVRNLSINGAKYPLHNYDLSFGDPRTVSNECTKNPVKITFDSGIILLIKSND